MSFLHFLKRSYLLGTVFVLCATILLSGCQQTPPQNYISALTSKKGVQLERFLPNETIFFLRAGINNETEKNNLTRLLQYFPQEDLQNFSGFIESSFNEYFNNENLNFTKDIMPALGSDAQLVASIVDISPKQVDVMQIIDTSILVFIPLAETENFAKVLETGLTKDGFKKTTYAGIPLYEKNEPVTYVALYQDVLMVSNIELGIKAALDRISQNQTSLLQNKNYQKAVSTMNSGIGFVYVDTPVFTKKIMKINTNMNTQTESSSQQNAAPKIYSNIIDTEALKISAENDGIRISGTAYINEQKAKEWSIDPQQLPSSPAYLYKKILAEKVLYYLEGYNLKKIAALNWPIYEQIEGFQDGIQTIKFILAFQGIDVEKDILSFMDKGFALTIRGGFWVIPGIDIYVDAESNPESAKKVIEKLHSSITTFLQNAANSTDETQLSDFLVNEKISDYNYRLRIDFSKIPPEQRALAPEEIINNGLQINYGINKDNLLYINSIPSTSTKTIADDETFKKSLQNLTKTNGIGYINPGQITEYLGIIQTEMEKEGSLTAERKTIFEKVIAYISPFKSIIFSSGEVQGAEITMEGFIHIAK